jgi:hypothetical protein
MRMLVKVKMPHPEFNAAVRDGSAGQKIGRILDELKPEAAYFTEMQGQRGAILIVNVDDPSKVPAIAEPFFLQFNADVEFHIVMSPEDLQRAGLEALGKKWA